MVLCQKGTVDLEPCSHLNIAICTTPTSATHVSQERDTQTPLHVINTQAITWFTLRAFTLNFYANERRVTKLRLVMTWLLWCHLNCRYYYYFFMPEVNRIPQGLKY